MKEVARLSKEMHDLATELYYLVTSIVVQKLEMVTLLCKVYK